MGAPARPARRRRRGADLGSPRRRPRPVPRPRSRPRPRDREGVGAARRTRADRPGIAAPRRGRPDRRRAGRHRELLRARARQSVPGARGGRPVDRHRQGCGGPRLRRLRHVGPGTRALPRARGPRPTSGHGERHDAESEPAARDPRAARGDRTPARRRLSLLRLPVHEQRIGVGDGGRPHRRRERQAGHGSRRSSRRQADPPHVVEGELPRTHAASRPVLRLDDAHVSAASRDLPRPRRDPAGRAERRRGSAARVRRCRGTRRVPSRRSSWNR